jgi:glycosyltransferase involved in cell wall biosynthesis
MVLPLDSDTVPCGHVTLVASMHLGKTFVVTRSAGIADYLSDPDTARPHGVSCETGSPQALADVIRALWEDPARVRQLAENGKSFAQAYCTEESMVEHFRSVLAQWNLLQPERIQVP